LRVATAQARSCLGTVVVQEGGVSGKGVLEKDVAGLLKGAQQDFRELHVTLAQVQVRWCCYAPIKMPWARACSTIQTEVLLSLCLKLLAKIHPETVE
jgi:hypothetical protein